MGPLTIDVNMLISFAMAEGAIPSIDKVCDGGHDGFCIEAIRRTSLNVKVFTDYL